MCALKVVWCSGVLARVCVASLCVWVGVWSVEVGAQERPRGFWMTPKYASVSVSGDVVGRRMGLVGGSDQIFVLEGRDEFFVDFGSIGRDINDRAVARAFFEEHGDAFDTLVIWTAFPVALAGGQASGLYIPVSSSVRGLNIGLDGRYPEQFDFTDQYGSQGVLRGVILMGDVTAMPSWSLDPSYNRGLSVLGILGQETLHQFGAFVGYIHDGVYRQDLVGRGDAHWSFFFHSGGSDLEGNRWEWDDDLGVFVAGPVGGRFSELDLYLMGWLGADEIREEFFLIQEPTALAPEGASSRTAPTEGARVQGEPLPITVDMIVDAHGPRIPNAQESPRVLRQAFVLLVDPAQSSAEREAAVLKLEGFRRDWSEYAYQAGRYLGRVNTHKEGAEDFAHWRFGGSLEGWEASQGEVVWERGAALLRAAPVGSSVELVHRSLAVGIRRGDWLEVALGVEVQGGADACAVEGELVGRWAGEEGEQEEVWPLVVGADGQTHTYVFDLGVRAEGGTLRELRVRFDGSVQSVRLERVEKTAPVSKPDRDRDGVWDSLDNCPDVSNAVQLDTNGDGVGDACEVGGEVCVWPKPTPPKDPSSGWCSAMSASKDFNGDGWGIVVFFCVSVSRLRRRRRASKN